MPVIAFVAPLVLIVDDDSKVHNCLIMNIISMIDKNRYKRSTHSIIPILDRMTKFLDNRSNLSMSLKESADQNVNVSEKTGICTQTILVQT